ncbi:Pyridoxal-dependent decarboxylase [Acidobacteriia bacterium SbA2]|nr:Pyridoxal-dependent decarboxylase [Acidobacteriia bacterium SbA2]
MHPDPYDPELFRRHGHQVVEALATYLDSALAGQVPVLPLRAPLELAEQYQGALPLDAADDAEAEVARCLAQVIGQSIHLHHPGYMGHQLPAVLPVAALADLISSLLNNSAAIHEMAQAGTQIERQVIRWLCAAVGWSQDSDGVLTSGGSLGNLTALLAARNHATQGAAWRQGLRAGPPLALLVSDQAHYTVARTAGVLGLGQDAIVTIPTDSCFRLDVSALERLYRQTAQQGKKVVAIVGSAGTTATGSFDPLHEMGEFCREKNAWFHIDGSHGASALFSEKYRGLTEGIELASSLVWDMHKMLFTPSLITAVLFPHRQYSYDAFSQEASYLFARRPEEADFDLALRTLECTKRTMGIKLWLALRVHGAKAIGELVTKTFDLAREFATLLKAEPDFELAAEAASNILCFRHVPLEIGNSESETKRLDEHQLEVRQRVVASGKHFLVHTVLRNKVYLRTTLMNPRTTVEDLKGLIRAIREADRSADLQVSTGMPT